MGERFNRNALTCLGSPGKPVVDTVGPVLLQAGDRLLLCSDGLWGSVWTPRSSNGPRNAAADAVPDLVEQALRNGGRTATTSRAGRRVGSRRGSDSEIGISTQSLGEVFASTIQAVLGTAARRPGRGRDRALDPEINEAIRRSRSRRRAELRAASHGCDNRGSSSFQRTNGRAADALRPVRITRHYTRHAEGSVLIEFGDTRVLCTASVEEVPPHKRGSGEGWVTAEYGMLPRATHTRSDREAAGQAERPHPGDPAPDRPLAARVFDLKALGERTITLDCDVLQADGGTRTAAITGASWPRRMR
jgi:hypothetical protein